MVDLMFVAIVLSMYVPIVNVLSKWQGEGGFSQIGCEGKACPPVIASNHQGRPEKKCNDM